MRRGHDRARRSLPAGVDSEGLDSKAVFSSFIDALGRISIGQRRRSVSLPPALDPLAARGQPERIDTPADAPAGHLPRRRDRDEAAPGRGEVDPGVTLPASRTPSRPASRYR
jgi:hypothetical protein